MSRTPECGHDMWRSASQARPGREARQGEAQGCCWGRGTSLSGSKLSADLDTGLTSHN